VIAPLLGREGPGARDGPRGARDAPRRGGVAARYAGIEARIEAEALLVPLFAPHRLALARRGVEGLRLGRNAYAIDLSEARCAR
jgi:hypothetical protein